MQFLFSGLGVRDWGGISNFSSNLVADRRVTSRPRLTSEMCTLETP